MSTEVKKIGVKKIFSKKNQDKIFFMTELKLNNDVDATGPEVSFLIVVAY